jgi:hypothetical protein
VHGPLGSIPSFLKAGSLGPIQSWVEGWVRGIEGSGFIMLCCS